MIPICIPRAYDFVNGKKRWRKYSLGVIEGVRGQTVPVKFIDGYAEGEYNSHRKYTPLRCKGEAASREMCRQKVIASGAIYCFFVDVDIRLESPTIFETLLAHLISDEKLAMVGCKSGAHANRCVVDLGIAAWRVALIPEFKPTQNCCLCPSVNYAIWNAGYKTRFINSQLYTEV